MSPTNRVALLLEFHNEWVMPRKERRPKVQVGTYLPEDLYATLQDFSELSGKPLTRMFEEAVTMYLTRNYMIGMKGEDDYPYQIKGEDENTLHGVEGEDEDDLGPEE